jgi:hypothetical protein
LSSTVETTLTMSVQAPMPIASVRMQATETSGARESRRAA